MNVKDRLLVLDDEPEIGQFVSRVAQSCGYEVRTCTDPNDFYAQQADWQPTHIVLDLLMPNTDGIEVLRFLADQQCRSKILIISGVDAGLVETARRLGTARGLRIAGSFLKPIRVGELRQRLRELRKGGWLSPEAVLAAIEEGQFFLAYQPKVLLSTQALVGFEALLRWQHPTRGLVPPGEFLPFVESGNLMDRVTDFVLATAVRQLVDWRAKGLSTEVAVNISASCLQALNFADRLGALVASHKLPAGSLTLELTETAAMGDAVKAMDILARLRLRGVRLSIDDFGTGYSSLVQLYRLPFSEVKIDRLFVADCAVSDEAQTITRAIVDLAHNLGMQVVAEGIESAAAASALAAMGCDIGQGFHIGRPMTAADLPEWLARHASIDTAQVAQAGRHRRP